MLLVLTILPFAILSFYSFPAVDDYAFALEVNEHGFWGAQKHWYFTWTGRYFSTFILSLNTLFFESNLFYQLTNFFVLLASIHSIYYLIRKLELSRDRSTPIILSLILSLAYLSQLPDLTQAFYWLPGSITYQLSLTAFTYLIALLFVDARSESESILSLRFVFMMLLAIIACASNEIMMLVTNFVLLFSLIYSIIWRKRGYFKSVFLQLWAIIVGMFVAFAPGNNVRGKEDFSAFNFSKFSEQIVSSIDLSEFFIQSYLLIPILPLFIIGGLSAKSNENTKFSTAFKVSLIIVFFVLTVVFVTFFTTFLSIGLPPPARLQNICFWFLVLGSFFCGLIYAKAGMSSMLNSRIRYVLAAACVFVILLFPFKTGFEYSVYDLMSGSASECRTQQLQRDSLLIFGDYLAVLPAYSVFPNSVYVSDLSEDNSSWWNVLQAMNYDLDSVTVDFGKLEPVLSYQLDFAKPTEFSININAAQIRQSSSGQSLYLIDSIQNYGPGIVLPYHEIWQPITHKLAHIKVKSLARISDRNKEVHVVVVLTAANGQVLSSGSQAWVMEDNANSDDFTTNDFFVHVDVNNHRAIDAITVYVLNQNQVTVELSSMEIELY